MYIRIIFAAVATLTFVARTSSIQAQLLGDWCRTQISFEQSQLAAYGTLYACCQNGPCDQPANRDAAIPDSTDPILYLRLYVQVLREDGGGNPATTPANLAAQITELNIDYLPLRVQFTYDWRYVNSTAYRYLSGEAEANLMKDAYAVSPSSQLNVYVTSLGYSYGTFPWDDVNSPLGNRGGVVLTADHFYPGYVSVLTHEIGHCIGLWHTHHGVSEMSFCGGTCSSCWERADGVNGDITGDDCSDTPPTPTNYYCTPPPGSDACSGLGWGTTDLGNFMGYTGDPCWSHFTAQQWGRIHCWYNSVLTSWGPRSLHVPSQYATIQQAIDSARHGDTVVVAPGTYTGAGNVNLNLNGKFIKVRSSGGPATTIIDCQGTQRGFVLSSAETLESKITGFTIRNGYHSLYGGGMYVASSPHIDSCVFDNCQAPNGGAMYITGASGPVSPIVTWCDFIGNDATAGDGGAIYHAANSHANIGRDVFRNNTATGRGGAEFVSGQAGVDVSLNNSTFDGNTSGVSGGAVHVEGKALLLCNTSVKNTCTGARPAVFTVAGTPVSVEFDRQNIANNLTYAIDCQSAVATMIFECNNFWQNTGGNFHPSSICQQGGLDGTNIFQDPLFCDFANGDYTLSWLSPCEGENNPCPTSIGAFGAECGPEPLLVSPSNGSSTTDHSPTLDWTDVSPGVSIDLRYHVVLDNNSDFSSPTREATELVPSTWTVTPDLTNGTWYWRARARSQFTSTRSIWGKWSLAQSFTTYTSSGGGGGSCPFVSVWDGKRFVTENTILTQSEYAVQGVTVEDYYSLANYPALYEGFYRVRIEERDPETSYLDEVRLLRVDAPEGMQVSVTPEGEFFVPELRIDPAKAVDDRGVDVLPQVLSADEDLFNKEGPGWLVVTYEPSQETNGRVFAGYAVPAKLQCPIENQNPKIGRDSLLVRDEGNESDALAQLRISYRIAKGNWIPLPPAPPREEIVSSYFATELSLEAGVPVDVKYEWQTRWSADELPLVVASDFKPVPVELRPASSFHSAHGKAGDAVMHADEEFAVLERGEHLELLFPAGGRPSLDNNSFFTLAAKGYYTPYTETSTKPIPENFALLPSYPNPFNAQARIAFTLPVESQTDIAIYNVLGQKVKSLSTGVLPAGEHSLLWDGTNDRGEVVASGAYFINMKAGDFEQRRKMTLLK